MRFPAAAAFLLLTTACCNASLISTSSARLPMSLSSVINDLEADDVSSVKTTCLVTSKGVTTKTKKALLQQLFAIDDDSLTAFGTDSGLIVALGGKNPSQVASTVLACEGRIVFCPDSIDLSRGEGLFDTLGPAIEKLLAAGKKGTLVVVSDDCKSCQQQLEASATNVLRNLVQSGSIKTLQDVFTVQYITPTNNLESVLLDTFRATTTTPEDAAASVAATVEFPTVAFSTSVLTPSLSHKDLAAARQLGPAARSAMESAMATVKNVASETTFVAEFGALCDATVQRALQQLPQDVTGTVASHIRQQLEEELYAELGDMFQDQIESLQDAYFDAFKEGLANLRISPTLETDSHAVAAEKLRAFCVAAKDMVAKKARHHWSFDAAKTAFAHRLKDHVSSRMLQARASGKFKPIPRKGVTVGFHWLLPKPFGNDYRQEPWMVHATDNLVYVPKDKITNVTPEEVTTGDWRSKIVPSPMSREMVNMQ